VTVALLRESPRPRGTRIGPRTFVHVNHRADARTVSVYGEVDAANAKHLAVSVCAAVGRHRNVMLDLTGLDFLAVDGIAALHAINAHMARAGGTWSVTPGPAAMRVLDLCDPEQLIPRPAGTSATQPGSPPAKLPA